MEQYPVKARIKDGSELLIRPLTKEDGPELLAFFRRLPEEDRLFLRDDVTKEEVIQRWIRDQDYERVYPLIALKGDEIVADAFLKFYQYGWARHMADVHCVVAREYQQKGLGTTLMRELVGYAQEKGVQKIVARMMDTQTSVRLAFRRIGFRRVAVLNDFVMDLAGEQHDLIVMVNDVAELWQSMEDLIMEYDVKAQR